MALPSTGWRAQIDNSNAEPINLPLPQQYVATYQDAGSISGTLTQRKLGTHSAVLDAATYDFMISLRQANVFGFILVDALTFSVVVPRLDKTLPRVEMRSLLPRFGR